MGAGVHDWTDLISAAQGRVGIRGGGGREGGQGLYYIAAILSAFVDVDVGVKCLVDLFVLSCWYTSKVPSVG